MTTVTYQNDRKFTSLVSPDFFGIKTFLNLKVMNLGRFKKNSVDNSFYTRKIMVYFFKNWFYRIFFKSAYLLLKLKEMFKCKNNWGSLNSFYEND